MSDVLLRFVHISDTHINPDPGYIKDFAPHHPMQGVQALVERLKALPFTPDFILHTGDVAYDPVPEVYEAVRERFATLDAPIYYLAGNHDDGDALQRVVMGRADDALQKPLHFDVAINGVQVVGLDSNGPADLPAGNITPEQMAFIDSICSAPDDDRPLVIAVHHNVLPVGIPWLDDYMRTTNGEDLHAVIRQASHRVRGVFHGHIHQNADTLRDGVLYSSALSSWVQFMVYPTPEHQKTMTDEDARPGFSVVSVTREQTFIRRHFFTLG